MIHRFRVQNFKSIVDVDVHLSPVTVLVGKSGTGKSSLVQALRLMFRTSAFDYPRISFGAKLREGRCDTGAHQPTGSIL